MGVIGRRGRLALARTRPCCQRRAAATLGLAVIVAAALTGALVAIGRVHQPDYAASIFGQSALAALELKSWLATVVLGLAVVQLVLALWLYKKLPWAPAPPRPPGWPTG